MSLDAYRGFTMLWMVSAGLGTAQLLHDPSWGWLADQLRHREWDGCTFWDLIQPSFLFIVGVAMPFSFAKRQERGESWATQFGHVLHRALLLCLIGMFLDSYARGEVTVQFIRVLQQIALAYTLAFFFLYCPWTLQVGVALAILVVHTLAYQWGGTGRDPWVPGENFGVQFDRWLHETASAGLNLIFPTETGDHPNLLPLSMGHYVTFNAFSSTSTILMGVLAGRLLRTDRPASFKLVVLIGAGLLCLATGWFLQSAVPMVKRLWTASFTLFAAGWTWLLLAFFYGVIDVAGWKAWAFPFVVVGLNSIFIYVSAGVLDRNIRHAVNLFLPPYLVVPEWRPVALAVLTVTGHWLLCLWLYRHKIFFKV